MKYSEANIKNIDKRIVALLKKSKKGLFIFGNTGTGKTYTLYAIKHRYQEMGRKAVIENWVDLLLELRDRVNYLRTAIEETLEPDILMFDDLGSEKQTEWSQEVLYMIVNKCYEREKKVFISTNLSLDQFSANYGDRIFSRLMEMCECFEMKGDDRRIE